MVGVEEPPIGGGCALIPGDGLVDAGAVDIAAEQRARAVIFTDQRIAIMEELGGEAADRLAEPAQRIVGERRGLGA